MLPESWINKIFTEMSSLYGSKFTNMWADTNVATVKESWARRLAGFEERPECIKHALVLLDERPFPPTLPEFLVLCRDAARRAGEETKALPYKPTPEEIEHQRELAHKVTAAVKPKEFDGLLWAKKPKSQKAMDMVADAKKNARNVPALASIFDQLVVEGIANEAGKLLKRWDGVQWVKA